MKSFLPYAQSPEIVEQTYEAIQRFAKENLGREISDRRIFRIEYSHNGKDHKAGVGTPTDITGEEVIVTLESNAFLLCTPNRGVLRGESILVGTNEVKFIGDFDGGKELIQ